MLPGPAFLESISQVGDDRVWAPSHDQRATLKSNVDVGLAWGLVWNEQFSEPWTRNFPNPVAQGCFADVLWRGVPILREEYLAVDSGRFAIPLPRQHFEEVAPLESVLMPYVITPWQRDIIGLVHTLSGCSSDFHEGLQRAGFGVE